jgi:hypothetical protein
LVFGVLQFPDSANEIVKMKDVGVNRTVVRSFNFENDQEGPWKSSIFIIISVH